MTSHPSCAEWWEWDEGNEEELARHHITPQETYEVRTNNPIWIPNRRYRAGDWKMLGRTDGGRPLAIVIRYYTDRSTLRPITGWDATVGEQSKYLKRS
jgi:hypothetical protein